MILHHVRIKLKSPTIQQVPDIVFKAGSVNFLPFRSLLNFFSSNQDLQSASYPLSTGCALFFPMIFGYKKSELLIGPFPPLMHCAPRIEICVTRITEILNNTQEPFIIVFSKAILHIYF